MSKFGFSSKVNQSLVDGILNGYKDYLAVRRRADEELKVSAAYAWTKGNHIDSQIDKLCSGLEDIETSIEKAGYTWEYIQIQLSRELEKYLLIVKNSRAVKKKFDGTPGKLNPDNYLFDYAGINNPLISSGALKAVQQQKAIQLELSLPEIEAIQKKVSLSAPSGYHRFYIVTYEIDSQSKMISEIKVMMPNQQEMQLVEVDDLTGLIETSSVLITEEELEVVQSDKIPAGTYFSETDLFGYSIADDKKKTRDKKQVSE